MSVERRLRLLEANRPPAPRARRRADLSKFSPWERDEYVAISQKIPWRADGRPDLDVLTDDELERLEHLSAIERGDG